MLQTMKLVRYWNKVALCVQKFWTYQSEFWTAKWIQCATFNKKKIERETEKESRTNPPQKCAEMIELFRSYNFDLVFARGKFIKLLCKLNNSQHVSCSWVTHQNASTIHFHTMLWKYNKMYANSIEHSFGFPLKINAIWHHIHQNHVVPFALCDATIKTKTVDDSFTHCCGFAFFVHGCNMQMIGFHMSLIWSKEYT